jgi:hypothetical protein
MLSALLLAAVTAGGEPSAGPSPDLSPPVRLEAGGQVIESGSVGHAAPFVGDFDGDGKPDLLVGQLEKGLLKVYRTEGNPAAPRLAAGQDFMAGAELGVVPAG